MYSEIIARARAEGRNALDEPAGKALLQSFGIKVPKSLVVAGTAQGSISLRDLTPPLAVKVVSRSISHKSDVGGVALNVADADGVARAITAMAQKPGIAKALVDG